MSFFGFVFLGLIALQMFKFVLGVFSCIVVTLCATNREFRIGYIMGRAAVGEQWERINA